MRAAISSSPGPSDSSALLVTATSTLRETDEPYRLLIELARGKLNQVRSQTAEWEGIGLRLAAGFRGIAERHNSTLRSGTASPPSTEADTLASQVLERSFGLGDTLVREFVSQMFDTRHHEEGLLDTRLAARTTGGRACSRRSTPDPSTPPRSRSAGAIWNLKNRITTGPSRTARSPRRRPPTCRSPAAR